MPYQVSPQVNLAKYSVSHREGEQMLRGKIFFAVAVQANWIPVLFPYNLQNLET